MKKNIFFYLLTIICVFLYSCKDDDKDKEITPGATETDYQKLTGTYGGNFYISTKCYVNGPQNAVISINSYGLSYKVLTLKGEYLEGSSMPLDKIKLQNGIWSGDFDASGKNRFSYDENTKEVALSFSGMNFNWNYTGKKDEDVSSNYVSNTELNKLVGSYTGSYTMKYQNNPASTYQTTGSISMDPYGNLTLNTTDGASNNNIKFPYSSLKSKTGGITSRNDCSTSLQGTLNFSTPSLKVHFWDGGGFVYDYTLTKNP